MKRLLICKSKITYRKLSGVDSVEKSVELGEQIYEAGKTIIRELTMDNICPMDREFLCDEEAAEKKGIDFIDNVLNNVGCSNQVVDVVVEENVIRKKYDGDRTAEEEYYTVIYNITDVFSGKNIASEFMVFNSLDGDALDKTLSRINKEIEWHGVTKVKCMDSFGSWFFSPTAAGFFFHECVGHLLEYEQFRITGFKLGEKLFNTPIQIFENWESTNETDDFGVPVKNDICIIRDGKISTILTAERDTGSGNACTQDPYIQIMARMNSMFVTTKNKVDNIFDYVKDGIYLEEITTGEFNPINGEIGLSVTKSKRIINGKLEYAYEPMTILFNIKDLINCNVMLDNNYETVMSLCGKLGATKKIKYTVPGMLMEWSDNGKFIADRDF